MSHVHGLGHIGAGVVDDHGLRLPGDREAEGGVRGVLCRHTGNRVIGEAQIDESGPGYLGLGDVRVAGEPVDNILGHCSGRSP